jgi:hypothetical protein
MCIGGIWHAVRGPAGVADANDGRGFCFGQDFLQICDSSAGFIDFELIVLEQGDAGGVISAVFKPFEAFSQNRLSLFL